MINLTELQQNELGRMDWVKITWAFMWRGMVVLIPTLLAGAIAGAIIGGLTGLLCGIFKYPFNNFKIFVQIISGILGGGIGFMFTIVQIKWTLKTKFKGFRFAIIKAENEELDQVVKSIE